MDNTTDIAPRMAMAKSLYCGLKGATVDAETRALSVLYSQKLFTSPWQDDADTVTAAYGERFFHALRDMDIATRLSGQWAHAFDRDNNPTDATQARAFITDFFRVHLHYPRDYHNFVCQRRSVADGGALDFAIEHPIAVQYWAVYVTLKGKGALTVNGRTTVLAPNTLTIVPPGCNCSLARHTNASHWDYHWLSFRSRLDWLELLDWAADISRPTTLQPGDAVGFAALCDQLTQLTSTTYLPDTLSERLCHNMIENSLLRVRLLAQKSTSAEEQTHSKVQAAVDYILNHYAEPISLNTIAEAVNSSPSRLSALFREHFGISVMKWRDQIRMQKAKELIHHSRQSITAIALQVGYPDSLYFSRRFKAHFGVAPSQLRR